MVFTKIIEFLTSFINKFRKKESPQDIKLKIQNQVDNYNLEKAAPFVKTIDLLKERENKRRIPEERPKKLTEEDLKTFFPKTYSELFSPTKIIDKPLETRIIDNMNELESRKYSKNISKSINLIFNKEEYAKNMELGMKLLFNKKDVDEDIMLGMNLLFNKKENVAESMRMLFG